MGLMIWAHLSSKGKNNSLLFCGLLSKVAALNMDPNPNAVVCLFAMAAVTKYHQPDR